MRPQLLPCFLGMHGRGFQHVKPGQDATLPGTSTLAHLSKSSPLCLILTPTHQARGDDVRDRGSHMACVVCPLHLGSVAAVPEAKQSHQLPAQAAQLPQLPEPSPANS